MRNKTQHIASLLRAALSLALLAVVCAAKASPTGVRYVVAERQRLERLTVYLTQGRPTGLCLAGTASGQMRRYREDATSSEAVTDAVYDPQSGCWRVATPESGYGYFVAHADALPEYAYLIDYTAHRPGHERLVAEPEPADPCTKVRLTPSASLSPMVYHTPSGVRKTLPFRAELRCEDLRWDEAGRHFVPYSRTDTIAYTASSIEVGGALTDTPYTLARDLWAEALGLASQAVRSESVPARRIELHAGVALTDGAEEADWQQLSAPTTLRLWARGNEPATARYRWRIERITPEGAESVLSHLGAEVEHTLSLSGQYRIRLEALGRDGVCSDEHFEQEVRVTESALEVPNAFSPGSTPGINDVFRVLHRSLTSFRARIFTSSGQPIHEWTDPRDGWDGTHGGTLVPTGAYYYAIDAVGADGIQYERRGVVHVLRSQFDTF